MRLEVIHAFVLRVWALIGEGRWAVSSALSLVTPFDLQTILWHVDSMQCIKKKENTCWHFYKTFLRRAKLSAELNPAYGGQ